MNKLAVHLDVLVNPKYFMFNEKNQAAKRKAARALLHSASRGTDLSPVLLDLMRVFAELSNMDVLEPLAAALVRHCANQGDLATLRKLVSGKYGWIALTAIRDATYDISVAIPLLATCASDDAIAALARCIASATQPGRLAEAVALMDKKAATRAQIPPLAEALLGSEQKIATEPIYPALVALLTAKAQRLREQSAGALSSCALAGGDLGPLVVPLERALSDPSAYVQSDIARALAGYFVQHPTPANWQALDRILGRQSDDVRIGATMGMRAIALTRELVTRFAGLLNDPNDEVVFEALIYLEEAPLALLDDDTVNDLRRFTSEHPKIKKLVAHYDRERRKKARASTDLATAVPEAPAGVPQVLATLRTLESVRQGSPEPPPPTEVGVAKVTRRAFDGSLTLRSIGTAISTVNGEVCIGLPSNDAAADYMLLWKPQRTKQWLTQGFVRAGNTIDFGTVLVSSEPLFKVAQRNRYYGMPITELQAFPEFDPRSSAFEMLFEGEAAPDQVRQMLQKMAEILLGEAAPWRAVLCTLDGETLTEGESYGAPLAHHGRFVRAGARLTEETDSVNISPDDPNPNERDRYQSFIAWELVLSSGARVRLRSEIPITAPRFVVSGIAAPAVDQLRKAVRDQHPELQDRTLIESAALEAICSADDQASASTPPFSQLMGELIADLGLRPEHPLRYLPGDVALWRSAVDDPPEGLSSDRVAANLARLTPMRPSDFLKGLPELREIAACWYAHPAWIGPELPEGDAWVPAIEAAHGDLDHPDWLWWDTGVGPREALGFQIDAVACSLLAFPETTTLWRGQLEEPCARAGWSGRLTTAVLPPESLGRIDPHVIWATIGPSQPGAKHLVVKWDWIWGPGEDDLLLAITQSLQLSGSGWRDLGTAARCWGSPEFCRRARAALEAATPYAWVPISAHKMFRRRTPRRFLPAGVSKDLRGAIVEALKALKVDYRPVVDALKRCRCVDLECHHRAGVQAVRGELEARPEENPGPGGAHFARGQEQILEAAENALGYSEPGSATSAAPSKEQLAEFKDRRYWAKRYLEDALESLATARAYRDFHAPRKTVPAAAKGKTFRGHSKAAGQTHPGRAASKRSPRETPETPSWHGAGHCPRCNHPWKEGSAYSGYNEIDLRYTTYGWQCTDCGWGDLVIIDEGDQSTVPSPDSLGHHERVHARLRRHLDRWHGKELPARVATRQLALLCEALASLVSKDFEIDCLVTGSHGQTPGIRFLKRRPLQEIEVAFLIDTFRRRPELCTELLGKLWRTTIAKLTPASALGLEIAQLLANQPDLS